jgi:large subunit ribosomal protein L4
MATKAVKKPAVKKVLKVSVKKTVTKAVNASISVVGVDGKSKGKMAMPKELFEAKINNVLMATAVRVYLANQREGAAATKTRGEVEGSTRKIYRQKGTGRARHGSIRAPIFVHGGVTFGPSPRDYSLKLPEQMKRLALASALTSQLKLGNIAVVDGFLSLKPKTKLMAETLKNSQIVTRIARNIEGIDIVPANNLTTYDVLVHKKLIFAKEAIELLKATFVRS